MVVGKVARKWGARECLWGVVLAALNLCGGMQARAAAAAPNILLIVVDDLGWMDLGCQGSDFYRTPHIDRLAAEGVRFRHGYAASAVCSPTRAAIQTGRYPHRIGVTDWIRSRFQRTAEEEPRANAAYVGGRDRKLLCPPNPFWMEKAEITIAEALQATGYRTGYIGKWHLGDDAWYPEAQGYQENRGGCDFGQPPSYFDPFSRPQHPHPAVRAGIYNLPGRTPGQFLTHREAAEAEELIRQWSDRPFFIQVAHYAVHTPIEAIAEVAAKYEQQPGALQRNAKYAAMVESVDDSVGRILAVLQELGIDDETLVFFTSDNGGLDQQGNPTDNAPLRSGKGYAYEGGIRVPWIVRGPGRVRTGAESDLPVCSIDLFPTLLDFADVDLPGDRPIDGISIAEHLASAAGAVPPERDLLWHFPHYRHPPGPYSILRRGDWKLIYYWESGGELYDLKQDPSESVNLADALPEKARELEGALLRRLRADGAKLPIVNPDFAGLPAEAPLSR